MVRFIAPYGAETIFILFIMGEHEVDGKGKFAKFDLMELGPRQTQAGTGGRAGRKAG